MTEIEFFSRARVRKARGLTSMELFLGCNRQKRAGKYLPEGSKAGNPPNAPRRGETREDFEEELIPSEIRQNVQNSRKTTRNSTNRRSKVFSGPRLREEIDSSEIRQTIQNSRKKIQNSRKTVQNYLKERKVQTNKQTNKQNRNLFPPKFRKRKTRFLPVTPTG